jgi:hypothetical protein
LVGGALNVVTRGCFCTGLEVSQPSAASPVHRAIHLFWRATRPPQRPTCIADRQQGGIEESTD